jgi:serine/threonine protein kinase
VSSASLVGRKLGGFTVERELGRGGMGIVVLARQQSLDRPAVLKRIHSELASHPELEARFEREAIAAGKLHHPNVVSVYDRFQHRGAQYLATEYVDGLDLSEILKGGSRLPWRIAATITLEVARGLEAIHAEGTLHRDLKPQNLLVGRRGEVKITDFGLALDATGSALTQPGIAVGTPPYMPPEQLRGERVDPRADLFALGCVLYEMLSGHTPFAITDDGAESVDPSAGKSLLARIESGRYARVRKGRREIPRALAKLVRRCLAPRVRRRIGSATEIRRKLEALLDRPPRAECQSTLASYLWERHVFEPRETETVVMVAREATLRPFRPLRLAAAIGILAVSLLSLGLSFRYPNEITEWTTRLADEWPVQAYSANSD